MQIMMNTNMNRRAFGCCQSNKGETALLHRIQAVDFALYDTILYLDAYPNCRKALAHYHSLLEMQRKLRAEYEAEYGPLTAFGNENRDGWKWTETPWPWEMS